MPSYKVIAPGFDGRMYRPDSKHNVLHRDEPFPKDDDGVEQVPSWLEPLETESEVAEVTKKTDNGLTAAQMKEKLTELGVPFKGNSSKAVLAELLENAENAAKVQQDRDDIQQASFLGDGESAGSSSTVETL